jgi:signal transduction histidine kinase
MKYDSQTKDRLVTELVDVNRKFEELKAFCHDAMLFEKSQEHADKLKALYLDLNNRNKDLEILNSISQAVHQLFDLEEIYKIALDEVTALENVDIAMIYLIDEDRNTAVLRAHRGLTDDYIRRAGEISYPNGVTWKVINLGEVVNIDNIQKDKDIGHAGKSLGHQSALAIPIILEQKVLGVIWFASYRERKFNKQKIGLLTSIGNQIGTAVGKAKLYKELSKKNDYEKIISAVAENVHRSINLQEVMDNALDEMIKNIDEVRSVEVFLVEGREAVLSAHRGLPAWFIKRIGRIPYPEGFIWKTILDGEFMYMPDTDKDTIIGQAGRKLGIKCYVSMPIKHDGKTIGALSVNSFKKSAFDKEEIKLLVKVAQQIETSINNAKHAEALEKAHEELEQRVEERTAELAKANELLTKEITDRKRAVKEIRNSREQLRGLAAHLQSVREEERTRIARGVHDELGQELGALKMELSVLEKILSSETLKVQPRVSDKIKCISELVDDSIRKVRQISTELRPGVLDGLGLIEAIEWQAQEFKTRTGINCDIDSNVDHVKLNEDKSTAIFRIFQETLTNVARHADATKVRTKLRKNARHLIFEFRDNGRGIRKSEISDPKSIGLIGMRERALLLRGELKIKGVPKKGTTVRVKIPLKSMSKSRGKSTNCR